MKIIGLFLAVILLCMPLCSCGKTLQAAETEQPSEVAVESASSNPTEESTPAPATDLTLNADGSLDGMVYKYNSAWNETSDPLTNAILRTYNIDLGNDDLIQLRLEAVRDEGTSAAVQNLRTQHDADREAVINSMLSAKEGTLDNATSEQAVTPPTGTRAMWSYQGKTRGENPLSVHGYSYVGGSQLYEVSVTGSEEAYTKFEPTWKSLVNQLIFPEIAPIESPSPTPKPTPVPTLKPTPAPTSVAEPASEFRPVPGWYPNTWSGDDWEGDTLTITVSATTLGDNYASYDIYGFWGGSSGESYISAVGEYEGAYVSYNGSIEYPDGTSHSISGRLIPTNKHTMSFRGAIEGRNLDPVELWN